MSDPRILEAAHTLRQFCSVGQTYMSKKLFVEGVKFDHEDLTKLLEENYDWVAEKLQAAGMPEELVGRYVLLVHAVAGLTAYCTVCGIDPNPMQALAKALGIDLDALRDDDEDEY